MGSRQAARFLVLYTRLALLGADSLRSHHYVDDVSIMYWVFWFRPPANIFHTCLNYRYTTLLPLLSGGQVPIISWVDNALWSSPHVRSA